MNLNTDFVERTRALFGAERYERFAQAITGEPVVSIRYNEEKVQPCTELAQVPWCSAGHYLPERPSFTADPLFHAGCYYVQEASSMFVEQVVKQFVEGPQRALDLCAAPGGKSTHLLSLLPKGSLLVSNEIVPQRAQVLAENIIKWGNPAAVVTRNSPADFSPFADFFDFVLVDAPCSGEGMFRKDSFAVEQWSTQIVKQCADRQREILTNIWPSLRPGGLLVYSTCTFNREENEECVEWIMHELGATPLTLEVPAEWNVTGALAGEGIPASRFIPGYTAGEGLFLAVLRKDGDAPLAQPRATRFQLPAPRLKAQVEEWVEDAAGFAFVQDGEYIIALPEEHLNVILALRQRLKVLHCGIGVAEIKGNKVLPQHSLAMSTSVAVKAFERVELSLEQALGYLHREAIPLSGAPVGHLLLTYKGVPLGFVKNIGNRANNMYPQEWRIRKNPVEL